MQSKTISWGLWGIAVVLAISGCVNVSAPKSIEFGGGDSDAKHKKREKKGHARKKHDDERKIDKDEAYTIAKDRAVNQGARISEYDIHDKKVRGYYWVCFERKHSAKKSTWKNHFVVRVSMSGRSTLYKPSARPGGASRRKIKKDDAYDVAHRIAHREGVRVKGYEIHDKEIDGNYWVIFETKKYRKKAGWKNHFAVRVSRNGLAEIYK
jgi:hypothetical protein